MDDGFDAIVIGAGPAGASAAILLARSGWRVALVEKSRFPRRKVCGECIAASNLPLLEALGVGEAFCDLAGPPLRRIALMHRGQTLHAEFPPYADARHPWGRALGREVLDTLLVEQARRCGVAVFQPWTALAVRGGPGHYHCEIAGLHSAERAGLAAPVMIGAHGSWEQRTGAGPGTQPPRRGSDLFAFKANFRRADLEAGTLPVLSFPGGYGGMVIGDHANATVAFCIRRDTLALCRKEMPGHKAAEAAAAYVARACAGARSVLCEAQRQGAWLGAGPIRPGIRIPEHGGHAFPVGNAAGEAHPIIGEGISMAIQSAWLLAEMLSPHRKNLTSPGMQPVLRQRYAAAWRRSFSGRIRIASVFAHVAMRPLLAGGALPWLRRYPQLLTHAARWSGKVKRASL